MKNPDAQAKRLFYPVLAPALLHGIHSQPKTQLKKARKASPYTLQREEVLIIHDAGAPSAQPTAAEFVPPEEPAPQVLQRFGDRVEIHLGVEEGMGASNPAVPEALLESSSETERFGIEALQLRASPEFAPAKADRPYDGEWWDMPGCAEAPDAGLALVERRQALSPGALEALDWSCSSYPRPRTRADNLYKRSRE